MPATALSRYDCRRLEQGTTDSFALKVLLDTYGTQVPVGVLGVVAGPARCPPQDTSGGGQPASTKHRRQKLQLLTDGGLAPIGLHHRGNAHQRLVRERTENCAFRQVQAEQRFKHPS
jgi:hypothetical protein